MPEINVQPDIEKPWRLDHCPDCGYSLEGSAESGICPECGQPFDRSQIILVGWDRKRFGRRGRGYVFGLAIGLFNLYIGLEDRKPHALTILVGAALIAFALLQLAVIRTSQRSGLTRVHLDESRCSQTDDLSVTDKNPWVKLHKSVFWLFALAYLLLIIRDLNMLTSNHRTAWISLITSLVVFAIIGSMHLWRRIRRLPLQPRNVTEFPWRNVTGFEMNCTGPEWHCLRITSKLSVMATYAIETDVRCTEPQAAQISSMVRRWRNLPSNAPLENSGV